MMVELHKGCDATDYNIETNQYTPSKWIKENEFVSCFL